MKFDPVVVGIYGISGSGKSRALSMIGQARPEWRCFEGRELIEEVLRDQLGQTLDDFRGKTEADKQSIREEAILSVKQKYKGISVVAGHASFPVNVGNRDKAPGYVAQAEDQDPQLQFEDVVTKADESTFDFIMYLDKPAEKIWAQHNKDREDGTRSRELFSVQEIDRWIEHEKSLLARICAENSISFVLVSDDDGNQLERYIAENIVSIKESEVMQESESDLRGAILTLPEADVFLLIDGDRTLCPMDTGTIFFQQGSKSGGGGGDLLKSIFQRYPNYEFRAFWEVAMLYETVLPSYSEYETRAKLIGKAEVEIFKEWKSFLSSLPLNVHAIVVTSGIREVFQAALSSTFGENHPHISLIAGNHLALHPYLVDSSAKAIVVRELKRLHKGCTIIAFGDSAVDIPMLMEADRGYVVIDDRRNRSMTDFLSNMVKSGIADRKLFQIKFSSSGGDSVDHNDSFWHTGIKVGSLDNLLAELGGSIHKVFDYASSQTSAALLATQSRRADLAGPALQSVHEKIGAFVAERLLDEFGASLVQEQDFPHVQGNRFSGFASCNSEILILALMRGGEPMARGVYSQFPAARFFHYDDDMAEKGKNALSKQLSCVSNVIIVDSVINEGNSIRRVLGQLESLVIPPSAKPRYFVLTAVMQACAAAKLSVEFPRVRFFALRLSENKFKGQGGTDTGNRLFGTSNF
ncbi:hypothetical protein ACA910_005897 [Epithemia clementina (nom. ined.)]